PRAYIPPAVVLVVLHVLARSPAREGGAYGGKCAERQAGMGMNLHAPAGVANLARSRGEWRVLSAPLQRRLDVPRRHVRLAGLRDRAADDEDGSARIHRFAWSDGAFLITFGRAAGPHAGHDEEATGPQLARLSDFIARADDAIEAGIPR